MSDKTTPQTVIRPMELSKMLPARRRIQRFKWCHQNFMEMSDEYRKSRERTRSPMDKCDWCGHVFANGEQMALAQPQKGRNWVLCQHCADELLST